MGMLVHGELQCDHPQLFWIRKVRTTPWMIFILSIFVNIGMWFERFVIIVTSLHRDYLPSSWAVYTHLRGSGHLPGQLRALLHLLPDLHPVAAHDRGQRSERSAEA